MYCLWVFKFKINRNLLLFPWQISSSFSPLHWVRCHSHRIFCQWIYCFWTFGYIPEVMWLFSKYDRKKILSIQLGTSRCSTNSLYTRIYLTFWIPLDLDSPGIPLSCLDTLRPITFCFCRFILISNGFTFFSGSLFLFLVLSARFFFFLAIFILFLKYLSQSQYFLNGWIQKVVCQWSLKKHLYK